MLFLKFQIGTDAYLLEARQIVEILPLVSCKRVPQAPAGVAGVFNYRGTPVPVIDLTELATGRPAAQLMSTRLILIRWSSGAEEMGGGRLLGLIAEKATETLQQAAEDFQPAGIASDATPYLGLVVRRGEQLLQRIEVRQLLPASLSELLYRHAQEDA